jgi:hypothetical protein
MNIEIILVSVVLFIVIFVDFYVQMSRIMAIKANNDCYSGHKFDATKRRGNSMKNKIESNLIFDFTDRNVNIHKYINRPYIQDMNFNHCDDHNGDESNDPVKIFLGSIYNDSFTGEIFFIVACDQNSMSAKITKTEMEIIAHFMNSEPYIPSWNYDSWKTCIASVDANKSTI